MSDTLNDEIQKIAITWPIVSTLKERNLYKMPKGGHR